MKEKRDEGGGREFEGRVIIRDVFS